MVQVYCTLYNSNYLDKGLVLYDSLCECAKDFKLYVLCMDDKCYEVLKDLNINYQIPIRLSEFEDGNEELIKAKRNRSMVEYCWTCSSSFIRFIFQKYKEPICTYIDADMYFYSNPQILVYEMLAAGKSVMMVPHRFTERNEIGANKVGKYCVEFNCFLNNKDGNEVLKNWNDKCLECCSNIGDGIHWGDQKYMDEWPRNFPDIVHVCQNAGAGLAPWNLEWYKDYSLKNNTVYYKATSQIVPVIFFHFESIKYLGRKKVETIFVNNNKYLDYNLIDNFYGAYLAQIDKKKTMLKEKYGIENIIKRHPAEKSPQTFKQFLKSFYYIRKIINVVRGDCKTPYIINFQ